MLQPHQMRSVIASQPLGTHSFLRALLPTLRRHAAASNSQLSSAAACRAAATTGSVDEQRHTPHVSVLLQEVLGNLNHMPIKVSTSVCICTPVAHIATGSSGQRGGGVLQRGSSSLLDSSSVQISLSKFISPPSEAWRSCSPASHPACVLQFPVCELCVLLPAAGLLCRYMLTVHWVLGDT
jgi:hypothetical protein